jgi:hypothetical protein
MRLRTRLLKLSSLFAVSCFLLLMNSGCGGTANSSSTAITPILPQADFSISLNPSSVTPAANTSSTITTTVTWTGTPTGDVVITPTLPSGLTSKTRFPLDLPFTNGTTSTASFDLEVGSLLPSTLTVIVTGSAAGGRQHSANLAVTIPSPPTTSLSRIGYVFTQYPPQDVAYDSVRKQVWASIPQLNEVLLIDPVQRTVLKQITVPYAGDMSLSLDGSQIVVTSNYLPSLTFIDVATQLITHKEQFTCANLRRVIFPNCSAAESEPDYQAATAHPAVMANGDVIFFAFGGLYRWSASKSAIVATAGTNYYFGTDIERSADGKTALITTTENETDIYSTQTDGITATLQLFIPFIAADPLNNRFAAVGAGTIDVYDTNLKKVASVAQPNAATSASFAGLIFSMDGKQLFATQSGLFNATYALDTFDMVNYKTGGQAPVSFGSDVEVPLAIDASNLIFASSDAGLVIDDPLNYYSGQVPFDHTAALTLTPNYGAVGAQTATTTTLGSSNILANVYFDGVSAPFSSSTFLAPALLTPGPATVHAFNTDGTFTTSPAAFTYGVQAVSLEPTAAAPSGGITADLIAYGVGTDASAITVTVGRAIAKVNGVALVPAGYPLYDVNFTVPPGVSGKADVTVSVAGSTATLKNAFTYVTQLVEYPYPTSTVPSTVRYDPLRQYAYLLSPGRIDVFSLKSRSFLQPIIPPSKTGVLNLTDFDLSVDGKTMLIANLTDQTLALVDPDNPSSATLVPLALSQNGSPYGPRYVSANSKGTFFVSSGDYIWTGGSINSIYDFDPNTKVFTPVNIPTGAATETSGNLFSRNVAGTTVVEQTPDEEPATTLLWTSTTNSFAWAILPGFTNDSAVSADGQLFSASVAYLGEIFQMVLTPAFTEQATMNDPPWTHSGWLFGQMFDPSGALLYIPCTEGVDIYDTHTSSLQQRIGVKESPNTTVTRALSADTTGGTLFLITNSGLDVIDSVPPLAIRSISPALPSASVGSVITVKGSGFVGTVQVTVNGSTVAASVLDANDLTFTLPSTTVGNQLQLLRSDGTTYTY